MLHLSLELILTVVNIALFSMAIVDKDDFVHGDLHDAMAEVIMFCIALFKLVPFILILAQIILVVKGISDKPHKKMNRNRIDVKKYEEKNLARVHPERVESVSPYSVSELPNTPPMGVPIYIRPPATDRK